jgi:hypothetical protein
MKKLIIALVVLVLVGEGCRTGYGCRGRESWNHMVRRINS